MQPTLHNMLNTLNPTSSEYLMAKQLLDLSNVIVLGSLALHIVFGGVMGFLCKTSINLITERDLYTSKKYLTIGYV
jgi:hypothetical protein